MLARILHFGLIVAALPAWLLGLGLPVAWLVGSAAAQMAQSASVSPLAGSWQLKLHISSLVLVILSAAVAMSLATIAAYAFARIGKLVVVWVAAGILVVPPLVYGYLWLLTVSKLALLQSLPVPLQLPVPSLGNLLLAGWAIGLWMWPIPALLLTAGWQWTGRPAWLLARMDTSDLRAFVRAGLPAMRPYIVAGWAACLLLAAQEYAIPALFSVQTWQTQYLALAQAGTPLGQLVLTSLPPAILLLSLIGLLWRFWKSVESLGPSDLGAAILKRRARLYAWAVLLAVISLATVVPAAGAVRSLTKSLHFNPQRFSDEMVNTPIIMAGAATIALAAGVLALGDGLGAGRADGRTTSPESNTGAHGTPYGAAAGGSRARRHGPLRRTVAPGRVMLVLAVAAWTVPISLIADSGKQAETAILAGLDALGRHSAMVAGVLDRLGIYNGLNVLLWVSVLAGRMVPVAWLLVAVVNRSLPAHLAEQAAVDGADRWQTLQKVLWPVLAPAAAAAWLICGLLVATDTVAAALLQPAGFQVLAVSMLNQMHYGRDGDIVATCMMALGAAVVTATVAAGTLGRVRRGEE